ncbi:MAG: M23 family metallopeptidase [Deltaproteobacteria bacterium]|nr:M23 family metallopeptidase [Candidatus Zymogenaceae bacterium]
MNDGRRSLFISLYVFLCIICSSPLRADDGSIRINCPDVVHQGEIHTVGVWVGEDAVSVTGSFMDRTVPFFQSDYPGAFTGYLGIDMVEETGTTSFSISACYAGGTIERAACDITVAPTDFKTQNLTMDSGWISFDEATKALLKEQHKTLEDLLLTNSPDRLWKEPFLWPAEGRISTEFGARRTINGTVQYPHGGIDIAANLGTPVPASNRGRVALVYEGVISGKTVVLDHGKGLYTFYCHLSHITIDEGDTVERGDEIGWVGGTGRVTGVHLHFSVFLNGACVNPENLPGIKRHGNDNETD